MYQVWFGLFVCLVLEAWQHIAGVQNNRVGRQCLALKVEGEGTDLIDRRLLYLYSFFPLLSSFFFPFVDAVLLKCFLIFLLQVPFFHF